MARKVKHTPIVGEIYPTNNFGDVEVKYFNSSVDVGVEFKSGFTRSVTVGNLIKGKILDPTVPKPRWKLKLTLEDFLRDAHVAHGNTYDYTKVKYIDTKTKVEITCKEPNHGEFWQTPEHHKSGHGCPICAGKAPMTAIRFKEQSPHQGKYNYSLITDKHFVRVDGKVPEVPIICPVHDLFYQKYDNHLAGQGCSRCANYGFNISKAGTFYVLTDGVGKVKVGITNRSPKIRLKEINKPNGNFSILHTEYHTSGKECKELETLILKFMKQNYVNTLGDFDGVTESFEDVDVSLVLAEIERTRINHDQKEARIRPK